MNNIHGLNNNNGGGGRGGAPSIGEQIKSGWA